MSKTPIDIEDIFTKYLAQEDPLCGGRVEEHIAQLLHNEMMGHRAMRFCLNPECEDLVYPEFHIRQQIISASPATCCPDCGGPVGTQTESDAA